MWEKTVTLVLKREKRFTEAGFGVELKSLLPHLASLTFFGCCHDNRIQFSSFAVQVMTF